MRRMTISLPDDVARALAGRTRSSPRSGTSITIADAGALNAAPDLDDDSRTRGRPGDLPH